MEYLVGVVLAIAVCVFGLVVGFDRDRVFYPVMVVVVATYYCLFAVMGASTTVLISESLVACGFAAVAVVAFKKNLWLAVAGLAGHGVFDFARHFVIQNPGVPVYWPGFCGAFDVLAAAFLAVLLVKRGTV
ncbi:MAG: hypothetical protein ABI806_21370 [Candidatus Solibacter sp.]